MSLLFSMMRNDFMPASRSLMPMHRPEKPAPTMSTSTVVTEEAADSVMRGPPLPCWTPRAQRVRGETRCFPGATGELRESGAEQAARHAGQPARFSVRRKHPQRGRVRRAAWNRRGELHRHRRESEAAEG